MAKTTNISIFDVFTQGQQKKVYSQIYKYCMYQNIVVEKDAYITKENERYVGAHVFPPVPGNYERVLPFDFASLYPSTIIAYNIDYSSWVNDSSIPDEKCNVFKWRDCIACIVGASNITVNNFGINIEDLQDNKNLILSHSEKTNLLEYKNQINFFNQGQKECIELIFEDGTSVKCTPDHKIMTTKNEWVEAQNIILNETKIKKGITYPVTNFKKYISKFELRCGKLFLNMDNSFEVEKFSKFSRLFGMIYTDGSIQTNRASIYCGDIIDAESVITDIYDVCGVKTEYKFIDRKGDGTTYFHITVPYQFHNSYLYNLGDGYGGRMNRNSKLPSYILDKNCPLILKREFIAGMFGGDGIVGNYSEKSKAYRHISFCKSKNFEYLENLKEFLESLQKILLEDFKIGSYLNGPYKKKLAKDCYTTNLIINVNDTIKFKDEIGFRYCTYKSFKLEVLCSYKNLNNSVFEQRERSFEIIRNLYKTPMNWKKAVEEGHKNIKKTEIIYNDYYAFPNVQCVIDSNRRPRDGNKKTFSSKKFPSFEKYLNNLNVYKYFVDDKKENESSIYCMSRLNLDDIPYYELKIIGIKNIGIQQVYDIEVKDNHSFLANGVVVHNCTHDPKVIKYNEITKYIDGEKDIITKLRAERDNKSNKLVKQKYIDEINKKVEALKPFISERSDIKKTISKNPMCEERYYRFLKEPKGVVPTILQNLLDARKNTRKQIKNTKCKYPDCGKIAEYGIEKETHCLNHKEEKEIKILSDNQIKDIDDLNKVLDKRQLAYKISANSMYGILGVKKGLLPFMPGAMCCTFMGRTNIEIVADTITKKYGGKLVYGDMIED